MIHFDSMNKKLKTVSLLLITACFLSTAVLSYAADKSSLLMLPTKSKTVYLLFLKMTGKALNAESAIRTTEAFKKASGDEQSRMLLTQKPALQTEFNDIDPQRQVVVIRSGVNLKANLSPNPGLKASLSAQSKPASSIYFPYSWGGTNIALIPDKLEPFLDIPLKTTEAMAAAAKITNGSATIVIEMLPLSADPRSAMKLDGLDQWLLMTRIVSVAYYSDTMQTIWQWQAPDYRRAGAPSPLQDLKK